MVQVEEENVWAMQIWFNAVSTLTMPVVHLSSSIVETLVVNGNTVACMANQLTVVMDMSWQDLVDLDQEKNAQVEMYMELTVVNCTIRQVKIFVFIDIISTSFFI